MKPERPTMEAARKFKIALDGMLILGAQVLLGFQLRGPFEKSLSVSIRKHTHSFPTRLGFALCL